MTVGGNVIMIRETLKTPLLKHKFVLQIIVPLVLIVPNVPKVFRVGTLGTNGTLGTIILQ
jgi:hypothetical protein